MSAVRAFWTSNRARSLRSVAIGIGYFVMPLLVTAVIGLATGFRGEPSLLVGVVDRAGNDASRALRDALDAADDVRVRDYGREAALRAGVLRGRLAAAIAIPEGWRGDRPLALWISDATPGAPLARARIETALAATGTTRGETPAGTTQIGVTSRVVGGGREARLLQFQYTAPANLVMFAMINGFVSASMIAWLRQSRLAARLLATPATRPALLAGLAAGPFQLIAAQAVFLLLAGRLAFGVSWGPPLAVALLTLTLVGVGTALSLVMGTVFRTAEQALALGPFLGIALGMLGGCWWPLEVAPAPLRALAVALPTTWAMDGYLELIARGGGLSDVAPNLGVLAAMALALFATAVARLRRELAR
jgi:ABC-2 type transport system permease protein